MYADEVVPDIIASYIVRTYTVQVLTSYIQDLVMVQEANTTFSYMQLHKELLPESISLGLILSIGHATRFCDKQEPMF